MIRRTNPSAGGGPNPPLEGPPPTAEHERLAASEARRANWKNWGPYVADRAWGTVREDYSADGDAWRYFPHEHARSRAYRWNEDGIAGFCNRFQNLCLAPAFWNGRDPMLKERFFGVDNHQGNHGEDVKEIYWHLDGTPTHSYMAMLYRYPQAAYPYEDLVERNMARGADEPEYELIDALRGEFERRRYFDVFIEYAKVDPDDLLCRVRAVNRGPDPAPLHVLPHLWFRNTWSWGYSSDRPSVAARIVQGPPWLAAVATHRRLGSRWWYASAGRDDLLLPPGLLFTENDTDREALFGVPNPRPFVKTAIHRAVVDGLRERVNPALSGTKAAAHFAATVPPGEELVVRVRFRPDSTGAPFDGFDELIETRRLEADAFHAAIRPPALTDDEAAIHRQVLAGLLWNKQFYHYSVELWERGDPAQPQPPRHHGGARNAGWQHLSALDVLSMPDKWEYPWFASWDLAFHALALALVDPEWSMRQLVLLLREWYMHPNGQIPAYEWGLGDANPPIHAWAALRVYRLLRSTAGRDESEFLERVFHKLLLNFTWWVNREDEDGNNVFQGGFLGLDNIGVFDRSRPLPTGGHLEQVDGTAWMAVYCLNMLAIAIELARTRPAYEDVATKFFEHFVYVANAFYDLGHPGISLWDDQDGFFYDLLHLPGDRFVPLRTRSLVGLIPLFAVETLAPEKIERLPRFRRRMEWFVRYRAGLIERLPGLGEPDGDGPLRLSVVNERDLRRILSRALDPAEFLSDHGIRSLSRSHLREPFEFRAGGESHTVRYEPGESTTPMFGGNSNWRGPVWIPLNYLFIDALRAHHAQQGDAFRVELPTGSGHLATLAEVADALTDRIAGLLLRDPENGRRPVLGDDALLQDDPLWRDRIPFHEYFHGETGRGLGAAHQTGWTALMANLLGERRRGD